MKRRRSFSNDEEQSTHITNTIGIISRPVQIHAPVQVLQRPPSSAGSSRLDISHGGWTAVSSNATTAALDPETVVNLLRDPAFRPGARPSTFSRSLCTWVFKEGRDFHIRGKAAAGRHSDRWCANLSAPVTRARADLARAGTTAVAAKQHVTCRRRTRAFGAGTSQYASGRPVRQLTSPPPPPGTDRSRSKTGRSTGTTSTT